MFQLSNRAIVYELACIPCTSLVWNMELDTHDIVFLPEE